MDRIVTVTPNAAWDHTLFVEELRIGCRQQILGDHTQGGGKGVNVARAIAAHGRRACAVIVVGGATGEAIVRDLAGAGLDTVVVRAPGESRRCLEILEARSARATQLHGAGVRADASTIEALVAAVVGALEGASWLALCGSLAPGLPEDTYARLVARARARGVRVALDASGPALRLGWEAGPDLVRVNREEAEGALGGAHEAWRTRGASAGLCVVSDGPRDALAWRPDGRAWRVAPPAVRLRNPIGCGDAMLAGLLMALDREQDAANALRLATALAAADAESAVAGRPDPARARSLLAQVAVRELAPGGQR